MFVIVTYDINAKRVSKIMKICRKYLHHVQKSVFEGMISEAELTRMKREIDKKIKVEEDSVCIYKFASLKYTEKEIIGAFEEKDNII